MEDYQAQIQRLAGEWQRGDLRIASNHPLSVLKIAGERGSGRPFGYMKESKNNKT